MKRTTQFICLLLIATSFASCWSDVGQNEEGFIYNTWSGEDKSGKVYSGGTHTHGIRDEMIVQTLETQSKEYNANVLSSNGLNVGVKIKINWINKKGTVKQHHSTYGLNGETKYIDPVVQGTLKDVIGKYLPEEIYSTKRELIESDIKNIVNTKFEESKIFELRLIEILDIDLPKSITAAIESKVSEEQTTLKEEQKAKTQTAKGLSSVADAEAELAVKKLEAEGNRVISSSITPQIIRLRELELKDKAIQKWNGAYPKVMGDGSDLLLDISKE